MKLKYPNVSYSACSLTSLHIRADGIVASVPEFFVEIQDGGGGSEALFNFIELPPEKAAVEPIVDVLVNVNGFEVVLQETGAAGGTKFSGKENGVGKVLPSHLPGVPQVGGGKFLLVGQLIEELQVGWDFALAVLHDEAAAAALRRVPGSGLSARCLGRLPLVGTEDGIDRCDGGEESKAKGDDRKELHRCNQRD